MPRREAGRRWRATVVRRLPVALMEYAFECFATALGSLLGLFLIIGIFRPGSLFANLPIMGVRAYALAAIISAATIFAGLVSRPRNPVLMAVGLRLFTVVLAVYAAAVVFFAGVATGGVTGLFFALIAALSALRSVFLQARAEEAHRAYRGE